MKQDLQRQSDASFLNIFMLMIIILLFLQTSSLFSAAVITGTVIAKNGDSLKVKFQPHETAVPKSGDKVDFYLEMEGLNVEAGTGSVTEVEEKNVWVQTSDERPDLKMNVVIYATGSGEIENIVEENNTPPQHLCDELAGDPWDNQRIGHGVKASFIDTDRAIKACINALKEHSITPRFLFQIARAYTVDMQYDKAFHYNQLAADFDYAAAQFCVGWAYNHHGKGAEYNRYKAAEWFRKAADQGHAKAQFELGIMYDLGDTYGFGGPKEDHVKAAEWFLKAAKQGYAEAQSYMGGMYLDGVGVEQDYAKAIELYRKAAEQGDLFALNDLGMMYSSGKGVKRNYKEAVQWYQKAALQSDRHAQYRLGELYKNGNGVPKNKNKAIYWFKKAAFQGHEEAKKELDALGINTDLERLLQ